MEWCSLSEMYRNQISQLRLKLALKEDIIPELQQEVANKNVQHQLPEVIERKSERVVNWFQSFPISLLTTLKTPNVGTMTQNHCLQ